MHRATFIALFFLLWLPQPLRADFLVATESSGRVLHYDNNGILVGTLVSGLQETWGLLITRSNTILVSEGTFGNIQEFDFVGNRLGTFVSPGSGGLSLAEGMLFDAAGNLIVADGFGHQILKYDGMTGQFLGTLVSPFSGDLLFPSGIVSIGNSLFVASDNSRVIEFDIKTGNHLRTIADPRLGVPFGITILGDSFLVSNAEGDIHRIHIASGTYQGVFAHTPIARSILALNNDEVLVIVDPHGPLNAVWRYSSDGTFLGTFSDPPPGVNVDGFLVQFQPKVSVAIDIKPGSFPNSVNPKSKGVIPVAILTTRDFDATMVDPLSVEFGPNGAFEAHSKGHIEDANKDGKKDLVLHFRTQETGIRCGDTTASLVGATFDGDPIQGSDSIKTVGCKRK